MKMKENPILDCFFGCFADVTTLYGPAASGKTNLCMLAALNELEKGNKVIYVDMGNNFSIERFKQMSDDYKKLLENIVFLKPKTFEEQFSVIEKLRVIDEKTSLVIVDTIIGHYRLELDRTKEIYEINRKLGLQISHLKEIANKNKIKVLITSQVHDDSKERTGVGVVGGNVIKYGSSCIIELETLNNNKRRAIIRKHPEIKEKEFIFEIKEKGFFPVEGVI
ncbi:DNA repair and recombination protein RadB [Candidatus Woesearchaeota archaeon]|nr:DNA repair and recombination protein RadB [Candidatus Woesearchaeota archaeon]